jgi:hypothetical protein
VLQAFAYRRTFGRELYLSSRRCLEQAVRDDPEYPVVWAMLAFAHLDRPLYHLPASLNRRLGQQSARLSSVRTT